MSKKIVIVAKESNLKKTIREKLLYIDFDKYYFEDIKQSLEIIYEEIPEMVIIETLNDPQTEISIVSELKNDPLFLSMILISIVPDDFVCNDWGKMVVDDYIRIGNIDIDLNMRIQLSLNRIERVIATNPLTKLPGNLAIQREIQKRLDKGEIFALAYADLDNFKPFNDKYGFSRGDEVIKMLGRIIMNIVRAEQTSGSFIGHIGGDDFVYIMAPNLIEKTTIKLIEFFENLVKNFYDLEDLKKGYLESINRVGERQIFPIMSISVGITSNMFRNFKHFSEMAEAASEMKAVAKKQKSPRYAIDRRRDAKLIS